MLSVDKKQLKAVPGGTTPKTRYNPIRKVKADVTRTPYGYKNANNIKNSKCLAGVYSLERGKHCMFGGTRGKPV